MKFSTAERRKAAFHPAEVRRWLEVARENGMADMTYRTRVRRGMLPEEAATKPVKHKHDPESTTSKQKRLGFSHTAVSSYRRRHPDTELTDDEILDILVENRRRRELKRKAVESGIPLSTIMDRLHNQGLSIEEACGLTGGDESASVGVGTTKEEK